MTADRFWLADEPQRLLTEQIATRDELVHLADARLVAIFAGDSPLLLHGHACAAFVGKPAVQGPFAAWFAWALEAFCRPLFDGEAPDFAILFDAAWWELLDAERRDRLVYHELLHVAVRVDENGVPIAGRDGRPQLGLVPHDRELFDLELLRYGPVVCGHDDLAAVVTEGVANAARRQLKVVRGRR